MPDTQFLSLQSRDPGKDKDMLEKCEESCHSPLFVMMWFLEHGSHFMTMRWQALASKSKAKVAEWKNG